MPGIAPVVGRSGAEVARRDLRQAFAAHEQRVPAEQLGIALRGAGDADRRQADRQRGRPGRQVVDEHQRHRHALLVRREADDLYGLLRVVTDLRCQRGLADDALHGAGPAEEVDGARLRRILLELLDLDGDVHVVVVRDAQEAAFVDRGEAAVEQDALQGEESEEREEGGRGQHQRAPLVEAAAERLPPVGGLCVTQRQSVALHRCPVPWSHITTPCSHASGRRTTLKRIFSACSMFPVETNA